MKNADWFFKIGEQVQGPLSPAELQQKAAAGEIGPDTLIRSGHREWRRAEQAYFLSEFFSPVERSEDWWQEVARSAISEEIEQCKGNLILLMVSCLLLLGVVLVISFLEAAGVRVGGTAGAIAFLLLGGAVVKSIFGLWNNGWEATWEAVKMIRAGLRSRPGNQQHGREKRPDGTADADS